MLRSDFLNQISFQFRIHSVCGLLGPRQVGKTTLAKEFAKNFKKVVIFDLEDPEHLAKLDTPKLTLSNVDADLIIIDEIQKRPELFPVLRVLVDEKPCKFLILGSASRDLLQQSSETLAGRIGYIELSPFSLTETKDMKTLWIRGGFPLSYLASSDQESYEWRQSYISTFLERDIPNLGFSIPPIQMRRLWMMLVHYQGQMINSSEIGKSLNLSHHTVKKYIDILSSTFMIRLLQPWYENISKRQIKTPKIYFRDSGLINTLSTLEDMSQLYNFPRLGTYWESFALEQVIAATQTDPRNCYFWGIQSRAELDLLIFKKGKRLGFEFKYTDSPRVTASINTAIETLKLDHLYIVCPFNDEYPKAENITVKGLETFINNPHT